MAYKDTDYLYISAYLRTKENSLLTAARMERMLDASSDQDALKILGECGYDLPEGLSQPEIYRALSARLEAEFTELAALADNTGLVDAFRLKYDYHNARTLLKAAALGTDASDQLVSAGTIDTGKLKEAVLTGDYSRLPDGFAAALTEAAQTLGATRDPQRCDFVLDRAYYKALAAQAEAANSAALADYVRCLVDGANLKAVARALRLGKSGDFLGEVLAQGGTVSPETLTQTVAAGGEIKDLYAAPLTEAAGMVSAAAEGGSLTAFERACDNALNVYLQSARFVPFGDAVLVSYLAAREAELTAARVILAGRSAGLPADVIRERLRDAYV